MDMQEPKKRLQCQYEVHHMQQIGTQNSGILGLWFKTEQAENQQELPKIEEFIANPVALKFLYAKIEEAIAD